MLATMTLLAPGAAGAAVLLETELVVAVAVVDVLDGEVVLVVVVLVVGDVVVVVVVVVGMVAVVVVVVVGVVV